MVVETDKGLSIGLVAMPSGRRLMHEIPRRVIRKADENDLRQEQRNQRRELEALQYAGERVRERKLQMKLFRVEYLHGGNKATFFFSSEGRVDFRDLVKDLTHRLHTRVELRQVGVRDEAKMVGGIGTCGRELCCSTWLPRLRAGLDPDGQGPEPGAQPARRSPGCAAGSSAAWSTRRPATASCARVCPSSASAW